MILRTAHTLYRQIIIIICNTDTEPYINLPCGLHLTHRATLDRIKLASAKIYRYMFFSTPLPLKLTIIGGNRPVWKKNSFIIMPFPVLSPSPMLMSTYELRLELVELAQQHYNSLILYNTSYYPNVIIYYVPSYYDIVCLRTLLCVCVCVFYARKSIGSM